MIRFNNDYNRGAFDCILKALADTNTTSYPGYGEDEWCDKAEQIIKGLIGRDDSMIKFIPGATQANYVVVAAALSPETRDIILRHLAGTAKSQIAKEMGVEVSTVARRYQQGMKELKRYCGCLERYLRRG